MNVLPCSETRRHSLDILRALAVWANSDPKTVIFCVKAYILHYYLSWKHKLGNWFIAAPFHIKFQTAKYYLRRKCEDNPEISKHTMMREMQLPASLKMICLPRIITAASVVSEVAKTSRATNISAQLCTFPLTRKDLSMLNTYCAWLVQLIS